METDIPDFRLPWVFSKYYYYYLVCEAIGTAATPGLLQILTLSEQREGQLIWPYHARISSCLISKFCGRGATVYASEYYFQ
jgi:hypothetical protein